MTLLDATTWHGKVYSDGWVKAEGGDAAVVEPATGEEMGRHEAVAPFGGVAASGTGSRFGGPAANVEAFTETQWLTMQGGITPYPF